jgi:hypothetical protein
MKHLIIFALAIMTVSQVAMAKESKRHQPRPMQPLIREIR